MIKPPFVERKMSFLQSSGRLFLLLVSIFPTRVVFLSLVTSFAKVLFFIETS